MTVYYAVVGASRGIGLEFVRQLASRPDSVVFALVRNKQKSTHLASAVSALNNVHVFDADVADHESLTHAAQEVAKVSGGKLDYQIHNAAKTDTSVLRGYDDFKTMDELDAEFIESFRVNALGVVHSTAAFLPLLRAAPTKRIVVIGSGGGDHKFVYDAGIASMGAYGASKGAAVVLTAKWAAKLKDEGFVVVTLSPGLVDTTGELSVIVLACRRAAAQDGC
ncbi:hypothetical protein BD413DRAFT_465060 [Trametes elegans]|nr:hypothetical protein BD413DRAFT_465060 [Trametes elegans]